MNAILQCPNWRMCREKAIVSTHQAYLSIQATGPDDLSNGRPDLKDGKL
jgi:hypothetical protein